MQKGTMLELLAKAEKHLPNLIDDPSQWKSLDVDYEPPRVERLYCDCWDYRILLHRIHPCEAALFHPHPWASAVKVLSGVYEMGVGYSQDRITPPAAATIILTAGSSYEMINPDGWHYVRPIGEPSLSLMVTHLPWSLKHPGEKRPVGVTLHHLTDPEIEDMFRAFKQVILQ